MITPSRHTFWASTDAVVIALKEAIDARKRARAAATDFERRFWRREMRYQARSAVAEARKYLRRFAA